MQEPLKIISFNSSSNLIMRSYKTAVLTETNCKQRNLQLRTTLLMFKMLRKLLVMNLQLSAINV